MPRVQLRKLESYSFSTELTVRYSDMNAAAHVGNSQMTDIIQESRGLFFNELGFSEFDLGDGKTGVIIADLVLNFRAEAFYRDRLKIHCAIDELRNSGFRLKYMVTKEDLLIALAETGHVAFNFGERIKSKIPETFMKKVKHMS